MSIWQMNVISKATQRAIHYNKKRQFNGWQPWGTAS